MNETQNVKTDEAMTIVGPGPAETFEAMGLDPAIRQALDEMGYSLPMEVQTAVYGRVVEGGDLVVQSRTGSGKTAAFGIPIAQLLGPGSEGVQALILEPTRELALQVARELTKICAYRNLQVVPVYGGAPMGRQIDALKAGAQIVVGTPGRILDHIRRRTLRTARVRVLTLDECDEMLSMGFLEDIERIIAELPPKTERQTLLFSATVPDEIERIGRRHMREFNKVVLSADFVGVHEIRHAYYLVSGLSRSRDLLRVLEFEKPEAAIVFCNTRDDTSAVASFLQRHGYDAEAISSDLAQNERERVMQRMREKNLAFLVATDIAARGIDISDLSHVINYQFPESPEVYIHRTGRTGRAGRSGIAISLVGPREIGAFYYMKLLYKIRPEERDLPSEAELRTRKEAERFEAVVTRVPEDPGDNWRSLARRVWQSGHGERVVAALLQRVLEGGERATDAVVAPDAVAAPDAAAREATPTDARPADRPPERRTRRDERRGRRKPDEGRKTKSRAGVAPRQDAPVRPEGREFWEAWVDEKSPAQEPASTGAQPSPPKDEDATQAGRPRRRSRDESEPGHVRLFVNVGRRDGVRTDDVIRMFVEAFPEVALGRVLVRDTHSYVNVRAEQAEGVLTATAGRKFGSRDLVVERAKR